LYKGESIYLGTTPSGFTPGFFCGAGTSRTTTRPSGYFSPVHKHLDLIKEAEAFVAQQTAPITSTKKTVTVPNLKKTTITCIKGKVAQKVTAVKPKCPAGYKKK
jgi:hypothetical protein